MSNVPDQTLIRIFDKGAACEERGGYLSDDPHPPGSLFSEAWRAGYLFSLGPKYRLTIATVAARLKLPWIAPRVTRLIAGSATGAPGSLPDAGGRDRELTPGTFATIVEFQ